MALEQNDLRTARARFVESLELCREIDSRSGIADCLEGLAGLALAQGQPERAARLFGMEAALRQSDGNPPSDPFDRPFYRRHLAAVRIALGEEAYATAWAQGRAMSLEEAIACALED